MKHQSLADLQPIAEVVPFAPQPMPMSRADRLERWAAVLEGREGRLRALQRVEFLPSEERPAARADGSPIEFAYRDPILRAEGLAGDRFGDAMAFFELSEHEAHHLLCDCHYGGTMTGKSVARRLRSYARRAAAHGIWSRFRAAVVARLA
jgi:hypothetical protein